MTRARSSESAESRGPELVAKTYEPPTAEVLSAVTHDLRNPLGTIMLGTSMLLTQVSNEPRARRSLEMIERAAHRMSELLERLTDLAGVQSGHLELDLEDVHANELIACALADRHVAVEQTVDNVMVRCDRRRVCHVVALAIGDGLRPNGEPVRIHVTRRSGDHPLFVIGESAPWRAIELYLTHGIIAAHGGELWIEGGSVFFTLPEA
ncbi:MAG TPA: histidine kinase dimerization/phospho-acceptor domain-containing protein [Kofleriaceae bacterium]|jgi:K+-sensing histidine kinase KdpD|nr:histidine kinase dimerization/phospho-acceptor domain-containing protein [Kofleriaceae bacterium]